MASIYDAQLDGFQLKIQDIQDGFEKAIAQYQFPYRAGALLEDMGERARKISFKCYFFDADYPAHLSLLEYIRNKNDLFDLIHPQYGLIKGMVQTVSVHHDDRQLTAEIDITFLENLSADVEPQVYSDIQSAVEKSYQAGQSAMTTGFSLTSLTQKAEVLIASLDAVMNTVTIPASSLISVINFGTSLPGRVLGSVARVAERYTLSYASLVSAPARFLTSLQSGLKSVETASRAGQSVTSADTELTVLTRMANAHYLALQLGYLFQTDEANWRAAQTIQSVKAFDLSGKYTAQTSIAGTLTAQDLESLLAIVRTQIQSAMDSARNSGVQVDTLQQMAAQLLEHVDSVRLEREKILTVQQDNPIPLHLLCLNNGLPYTYAARISGINRFRNPNFVKGNVKVYAR